MKQGTKLSLATAAVATLSAGLMTPIAAAEPDNDVKCDNIAIVTDTGAPEQWTEAIGYYLGGGVDVRVYDAKNVPDDVSDCAVVALGDTPLKDVNVDAMATVTKKAQEGAMKLPDDTSLVNYAAWQLNEKVAPGLDESAQKAIEAVDKAKADARKAAERKLAEERMRADNDASNERESSNSGGGSGDSDLPAPAQASSQSGNQRTSSAPPVEDDSVWDRLAECESGGDWSINTGNGFSSGLQFTQSSWEAAGGTQYAPVAHEATREEQIATGKRLQEMQGWGAWPACSAKLGLL